MSFPEDIHNDIVRDWDFVDPYNVRVLVIL